MFSNEDTSLLRSAQIALLGEVTPRLRSVSFDRKGEYDMLHARFVFDGEPTEDERDSASCVMGEVLSHFSRNHIDYREEFVACPRPRKIENLRLLAYLRNEEPWTVWA